MNLAYVPAAPTAAALTFDLAVSAAQIFGGIWECGAGAIHAENQALRWLARLAGWDDDAGGTFVQGATVGNLSALVAARHRARRLHGEPRRRWRIAATEAVHSSIAAAAEVMDVDVAWVPGDDVGRLTGEALRPALEDGAPTCSPWSPTSGPPMPGSSTTSMVSRPCAPITTVGSTSTVRTAWRRWSHPRCVPASAASNAPTASWSIPTSGSSLPTTAVPWCFATPRDAAAHTRSTPGTSSRSTATSGTPRTTPIQLSRRARGLPFWFSLATYGTDRYAAAVETVLATTAAIVAGIQADAALELVMEPDLSVVLFRRPGWSEDTMRAWSAEAARTGTVLIVPTRWQGELVFRLCLVNPRTEASDVLAVLATMGA